MKDRILSDREKAMEDSYFRQQDELLVKRLRQEAGLDEIAKALKDKLEVDNPELLARAREVGMTADTATALFVAPLVQVAWAGGSVARPERDAVLRLARARGIEATSPAYAQILDWLGSRPSDALFDTAVEVIKSGFAVLPLAEREERIKRVVNACREVAEASGSEIARLLGLGDGVSRTEASMLDTINNKLRIRS
jgi:hypothetical protein